MKNRKPVKIKLPALLPDQVAYINKLKRSEQRGWKPALKIVRDIAKKQLVQKTKKKKYKILKNGKVIASVVPGKYAGHRPRRIFGQLDCKSGMRMKKENRVFFLTWQDAIREGYRPCKNCKPTP